ncbi:hypothetical protein NDU88_004941 [Pleurodeles waltl]|uniref:Uncharacterized protein n=1 Tax=Pleurodeles waltl TaxID=8319 RepID=A0AAV7RLW4_PLEWA|nr:hypothetical protein NDU88_004941 [Pleurodeles waltl]
MAQSPAPQDPDTLLTRSRWPHYLRAVTGPLLCDPVFRTAVYLEGHAATAAGSLELSCAPVGWSTANKSLSRQATRSTNVGPPLLAPQLD